jgi:hypothetical protein
MSSTHTTTSGPSSSGSSSSGPSSSDLSGFDTRLGPEDPDRPVAVPAGELDEWAWLLGRLTSWLDQTGPPTAADFARYFHRSPTLEGAIWHLDQISERMAALLDGRALLDDPTPVDGQPSDGQPSDGQMPR